MKENLKIIRAKEEADDLSKRRQYEDALIKQLQKKAELQQ